MTSNAFGYMDYDPNTSAHPTGDGIPYMISPIDIQICYKKLFDIYCGAFVEKRGEFLTLLRIYNGDYRRTILSIEIQLLSKENEKMKELFETKLD